MLRDCRVVDCTDHRGHLGGFMLAQMGADVILVEPPEGSTARRRAPFAEIEAESGLSLWHAAHNRGKRSLVIDHADPDDAARFDALLATADILLWSGHPSELPLDLDAIQARHPTLIVAVLTPFGLDGPKADWHDTDITVCASACQLAVTGDTDRPPLRTGVPQGFLHGAADLAVGALVALQERHHSGRGQLVDVSAQTSYLQSSFAYNLNTAWGNEPLGRSGEGVNVGLFTLRWGYPAADGEVSITLLFGAAFKEFTGNLFNWIYEEGGCDEATRDKPWEDLIVLLFDGQEPVTEVTRLADVVAAFTGARTKAELMKGAIEHRVLLAPVATIAEVMDHDHLAVRGMWDRTPLVEGGPEYRHLGRFIVAPDSPLRVLDRAPELGEHTEEVLGELDPVPVPAALPAAPASTEPRLPLEGLKVVDLSWSIAGPYVGRGLADFGATVVKVESQKKVDVARTVMPLHPLNEEHPQECGGLFANCNAGKLGIELDLTTSEGREILWDLLRWADVVVESFSAGAFARMGFGYDAIAAENPGLILFSSSLPGQSGSLVLPGYGNLSSAMFGFHYTTRWPDRPAAGPFGAYTDTVSPRFGLAGILGALEHRRRTGRGQHLDLSQVESSLHLLSPALLDMEVNGRDFESIGNADLQMAPHGVYPVLGDDRWVAAACTTDEAWGRLAAEIGRPDLAGLDVEERLARRDELDDLVASWTAELTVHEAEGRLQALGVAAHGVQNSAECLADPQLAHRGHYVTVEHPYIGPIPIEGPRFALSRTPGRAGSSGPTYGEHAFHILTDLLGYDEDRFAEMAVVGALG
jgi:crotonobetainyl-CoA:carnitine CoA-transferase CaiB-like acyl-CoA transferase